MSDNLKALIALIDHNQVYDDLEELDRETYLAARSMLLEQAARIRELEAQLADGSFYKEDDIDALQARADRAEAALREAQQLRKAAGFVSEWFFTYASHLEGPRIQALRMAMVHYDVALAAMKGGAT